MNSCFRSFIFLALFSTINLGILSAQKFIPNYDEEKVPTYTLPDPLSPGGKKVTSRADWESHGRATTLGLFYDHVYGKIAKGFKPKMTWKIEREDPAALGGIAIRRQYLVTFENKIKARLLVYIPRDARGPVPGCLGLNFRGNQLVEADP
ncbi:MAG: acetylxylan esterase, partial [Akkermansiaceae bacterium]